MQRLYLTSEEVIRLRRLLDAAEKYLKDEVPSSLNGHLLARKLYDLTLELLPASQTKKRLKELMGYLALQDFKSSEKEAGLKILKELNLFYGPGEPFDRCKESDESHRKGQIPLSYSSTYVHKPKKTAAPIKRSLL